MLDVGIGNAIAHCPRVVPDGGIVGGVEVVLCHEVVILRQHVIESRRQGVSPPHHPIRGVRDGGMTGRLAIPRARLQHQVDVVVGSVDGPEEVGARFRVRSFFVHTVIGTALDQAAPVVQSVGQLAFSFLSAFLEGRPLLRSVAHGNGRILCPRPRFPDTPRVVHGGRDVK